MATMTVGLFYPGDMGHAVAAVLGHHGVRVITNLAGRSPRTATLAAKAGVTDVGSDDRLVAEADLVLSILAPAAAREIAGRAAAALQRTNATTTVVDCNAIAPQTVLAIEKVIVGAGGRFVDGGIIGGPPKIGGSGPSIYASGQHAAEFARLANHGLNIRVIGDEIGQASGLKMCYAAITKGMTALATQLLVAAEALNLRDALMAEFQASQSTLLPIISRSVPGMPPKAYRWVGEMEEIAATFGAVGITPTIFEGIADLYRWIESTPLGQERPENRAMGTDLDSVVRILAAELGKMAPAAD